MKKIILLIIVGAIAITVGALTNCGHHASASNRVFNNKMSSPINTIYLAGGCFWGTEHFMQMVPGVVDTEVGYANSTVASPSYQQVCTGATNAAETVRVDYDPTKVSLTKLLELYFLTIDPLSLNRQGNDTGTQYRTGIYYTDSRQVADIQAAIDAESTNRGGRKLAVEVMPLHNFFPAEDYHQDYLDKNPGGYCHISPALMEMARQLGACDSKR